jgi:hypothetical protein
MGPNPLIHMFLDKSEEELLQIMNPFSFLAVSWLNLAIDIAYKTGTLSENVLVINKDVPKLREKDQARNTSEKLNKYWERSKFMAITPFRTIYLSVIWELFGAFICLIVAGASQIVIPQIIQMVLFSQ